MNLGMILARFGYNSGIIIYMHTTDWVLPKWAKLEQGENKMKIRTMTGILIVALVALSAGVAAAQYGQGSGAGGAQYVDADGDGICDNIGTCPRSVDADGDGVCDNLGDCGRGRGGCGGCGGCGGTEFVDSDGDGVCDNIGINCRDSDGDGIPDGQDDDYEPLRDGSGQGKGRNR